MTVRPFVRALPLFTLLAAASAAATTMFGNPEISLILDSGNAVEIGDVRAYTCPGYQTFPVDDVLTVTNDLVVDLGTGTWCRLVVQVEWAGTSSWDLVEVAGFDTLQTSSSGQARTITFEPGTRTATIE